jgi:hypothetical protein
VRRDELISQFELFLGQQKKEKIWKKSEHRRQLLQDKFFGKKSQVIDSQNNIPQIH